MFNVFPLPGSPLTIVATTTPERESTLMSSPSASVPKFTVPLVEYVPVFERSAAFLKSLMMSASALVSVG